MYKVFLINLLCLFLIACGGGNDGRLTANDTLTISGIGQTVTVNSARKTDLSISGSGNIINIETNLGVLTISGSNNLLNFSANITVNSCTISGSDNTGQKAGAISMACNDSGIGNSGF